MSYQISQINNLSKHNATWSDSMEIDAIIEEAREGTYLDATVKTAEGTMADAMKAWGSTVADIIRENSFSVGVMRTVAALRRQCIVALQNTEREGEE